MKLTGAAAEAASASPPPRCHSDSAGSKLFGTRCQSVFAISKKKTIPFISQIMATTSRTEQRRQVSFKSLIQNCCQQIHSSTACLPGSIRCDGMAVQFDFGSNVHHSICIDCAYCCSHFHYSWWIWQSGFPTPNCARDRSMVVLIFPRESPSLRLAYSKFACEHRM